MQGRKVKIQKNMLESPKYLRKMPQLIYKQQPNNSSLPLLLNNLQLYLRKNRSTSKTNKLKKQHKKCHTLKDETQALFLQKQLLIMADGQRFQKINKGQEAYTNIQRWKEKNSKSIDKSIKNSVSCKNPIMFYEKNNNNNFRLHYPINKTLEPLTNSKHYSSIRLDQERVQINIRKKSNKNNQETEKSQESQPNKQKEFRINNAIALMKKATIENKNLAFEQLIIKRKKGNLKPIKCAKNVQKKQLKPSRITKLAPWSIETKIDSDEDNLQ